MADAVHGHCEERFATVREAFARNFRDHGEVGAALCVYQHGRPVVDLWGGVRDRPRRHRGKRTPWSA